MRARDSIDDGHVDIVRNWKHFDAEWYLNEYSDVRLLGLDPAYHYLWVGARIGRKPSAGFARFPNRHFRVSDLVEQIRKGDFLDQAVFENTFYGLHLGRQPAEFIQASGNVGTFPEDMRVAVHAHMFYPELAEEFGWYLSQVPGKLDLYASSPTPAAQHHVQQVFSALPNVRHLDVRVTPNVGRDLAPFVVEFGQELSRYEVIGHIQTKKSFYNNGLTDGWREYLLDALFENPARIASYFQMLQSGRYGIIYPQCFYKLPYMAHTWLANAGLAQKWGPQFGVETLPSGYFDFPAGSMFWARTDALRPLLEANIQWQDFAMEAGQTDGTLAHCIERMLGVVPTSRHYQHGVIADTQTPSWSRWRLDQFTDRPLDAIHAVIAAPETAVVAFDIFDTLISRPFLDADFVKQILHDELEAQGLHGFRGLRVRSESLARNRHGRDVSIDDIYRELSGLLVKDVDAPCAKREIDLEIKSVQPRRDVVDLMKFAVKSGKRVVLASDMFLPRSSITAMLERCGITGWRMLYLSSQTGVRKDSGKLYEHILEAENVAPSEMVMIGDNERADIQIPGEMGIRVIHTIKPVDMLRAMPRLADLVPDAAQAAVADQFLFGAIALNTFSAIHYPQFCAADMFGADVRAIGYSLLGPVVVAFSQFLLDQAHENGLEQFHFLAREGQFLKRAFDGWQSGRDHKITSEYLLISRRAITVPCIRTIDDIFGIAGANDFHGASMSMLLAERFGTVLSKDVWVEARRCKLWDHDSPLTILNGEIDQIRPFLTFIAPYIFEQAAIEHDDALAYCRDRRISTDERAAIVDVGYGSTIQRHLMMLLGSKVHGLYMMTNKRGSKLEETDGVLSRGCFVQGAENGQNASPFFRHSFILEKMLSSDDEQVIRYTSSGGVEFREAKQYAAEGRKVRAALQEGALAFVSDAVRFRDDVAGSLYIEKSRCEQLFSRFVEQMSLAEKTAFASLVLDDYYCGRGVVSE